jgi:hypothetical protein
MRTRKYLIGAIAALGSVVALSSITSVASADVVGLRIGATETPTKQKKKERGPAKIFFESNDIHQGAFNVSPCAMGCYAYPASIRSFITFPKDLKFTPGNIPDCNLASIVGKSTALARQACPQSVVGEGGNVQAFSDGRKLNGVITAFNGAPSGGKPTLYIHVDLPGVATKPILTGVISGNTLDVTIPPVPGAVIDHLDTTLNKIKSGKKKGKPTYYLSSKCSKKKWTTTEDVTYQNGQHEFASVTNKCKQTKA